MGVGFTDLIYPMKMKYFGLTETKLFHFHKILKNGGQGGGFICIKGVGVGFTDLIYPMKMKYFGLTETKLFHFHRILKNGGGGQGGGFKQTP